MVRNVHLRGISKLADRWESNVYVILRQSGDLPVYVVRPETGEGPQRKYYKATIWIDVALNFCKTISGMLFQSCCH